MHRTTVLNIPRDLTHKYYKLNIILLTTNPLHPQWGIRLQLNIIYLCYFDHVGLNSKVKFASKHKALMMQKSPTYYNHICNNGHLFQTL